MFSKLEDDAIVGLSVIGRWRRIGAGKTLFEEGERGSEMFIVAQGRVALHKSSPEGPRFLAERERGEILGEMAVFDGRRRSATAVGGTDCLLLAIAQPEFIACVRSNPSVALGMIANLIDRLREADTRALRATSLGARGRLAFELLERARIVGDRQLVRPRPTAVALAERIGSTRETVSRRLGELESQALIALSKTHIEILDERTLQGIVGD